LIEQRANVAFLFLSYFADVMLRTKDTRLSAR